MVRHKTGLCLQELTCVFPFHFALSPKGTPAHPDQKHILTETAEDLNIKSQSVLAEPEFPLSKTGQNRAWGSRERPLGADKRSKSTCILEVMGNGRSKKGAEEGTGVRLSVDAQPPPVLVTYQAWNIKWWLWEPGVGRRSRGKTSLLDRTPWEFL